MTPVAPLLSFSALILAGGQSSRMGHDKALLPVQEVPLLRYVIEQALPIATVVYVMTAWPERYQAIVPRACHLIREQRAEGEPGEGPLVAFSQGLTAVSTPWVLLLACDLPYLTTAALATWRMELASVPPTAIALLPKHSNGWEPLCGFYRRSCQTHLDHFLASGGRSFQRWLEQEWVEEITVSDRQVLFNCNTPADWQRVQNATEDV